MIDHPPASPRPSRWRVRVLSCLSCLVLGASQASALPAVQVDPSPGFLLAQAAKPAEQSGSEEQAQENRQAPFAELNKLLEDTRARLDELFSATAVVAEQRKQIETLKQETERLAGELEQANTRRAELEQSQEVAEARIAELSNAVDVAVGETIRIDEELAGVRRQNADLEERLARAETAREVAESEVEESRTELEAAEQSKAEVAQLREELDRSAAEAERVETELAEMKEQLGQAASAAVEAERAREAASSEADQLRGEAEQAREELAAAKREVERVRTANAELETQLASLHADSESAIETARQNLIVMEEKFEELNAALAGAGFRATTLPDGPQENPDSVADERSTGSNLLSGIAQPAAPGPADDELGSRQEAESGAELAARGPASAPAQEDDGSGLARFDANVQHLNSRALEAAGADLFSGIEAAGEGVVHVSTTRAWQNIPPAGQRSYLNSLFDLWTVARDGSGPAVVRIVDGSGRVLLEKSGTAKDDD